MASENQGGQDNADFMTVVNIWLLRGEENSEYINIWGHTLI